MLEHRGDSGFAKKALLLKGVVGDLLVEALICDDAAEVIVPAGLDQTFPALRDGLEMRVPHIRVDHVVGQVEIRVLQMDDRIFVLGMREEPRHSRVPVSVESPGLDPVETIDAWQRD